MTLTVDRQKEERVRAARAVSVLNHSRARHVVAVIVVAAGACVSFAPRSYDSTPAQLYGELFRDVQLMQVLGDSKTFVDAVPRRSPQDIVSAYQIEHIEPDFDLASFVKHEFTLPAVPNSRYHSSPTQAVREHIDRLWSVLTRSSENSPRWSSRLPLPYRYVVPGGRFDEIYYWDSYFTMLGLRASGEHRLVREMCDNFAYLIRTYGHVPNGNRTYYLSRSQPPFFASMVELVAAEEGPQAFARYREELQSEYDFWMEGAANLPSHAAHRRVVRLADTILNRYWDDRDTPREEAYREDVATAQSAGRPERDTYRNLRAAAESGWDFSSRWFADNGRSSIRTVEIVPVDLNALLYHLELTLARAYAFASSRHAQEFQLRAARRREAMMKYMWNPRLQAFTDYSWTERHAVDRLTAVTVTSLFFGIATDEQARLIAQTLRTQLLKQHGLVTTTEVTGEQWDAPNGWAPLQWMAIEGLRRYGQHDLANLIAARWIELNTRVYRETGKLVEKYDVVNENAAGGGEYPLQDGFGWTNGVLRALLQERGDSR